jgi:hypothetical protein
MEAADRTVIRWYPRSRIEKYSPDQVTWARGRLAREFLRGGVMPPLGGDRLRVMFPEPEGGVAEDEGNGVTAAGLANLALVLTGGGHPLSAGRVCFGVGSDPAAFDSEQVHLSGALGEEPGRSWYKPMDAGYPRGLRPSVIEGQATFTESEACFGWHEWCWGTGPLLPEAHHSLRGAYAGEPPVMVNRKASAQGFGVKEPGVAWVFRTEVALLG